MVRGAFAAALFAASACYSPTIPNCAYSCESTADCPGTLDCVANTCRVAGSTCATGDGGSPDGDGGDHPLSCEDGVVVRGELCLSGPFNVDQNVPDILRDIQVADVDGDETPDLVGISGFGPILYFKGTGTGFGPPVFGPNSMYMLTELIATQLVPDGPAEIFVAGQGGIEAYRWSNVVNLLQRTDERSLDVPSMDLPTDIDLGRYTEPSGTLSPQIAMSWNTKVMVHGSTMDNDYTPHVLNFTTGGTPALAIVPTTNGSPDKDAVIAASGTTLVRLQTNLFGASETTQKIVGFAPTGLASGDLDGDGDYDLIATDIDSAPPKLRLLDGDPADASGFGFSSPVALLSNPGLMPEVVVANLDGDDFADVIYCILRDGTTFDLTIRRGAADDASRPEPVVFTLSHFPAQIHVGDINRDGAPDIIVTSGGVPSFITIIPSHP